MKISNISKINSPNTKVYDVIDVYPNNNFQLSTKSGRNVISHNSVLARMGSRFMIDGKIAGMLFLVSSKKSEYDFIESYIQKKKGKENIYVCDARLWDVKPTKSYCGKKFYIAIGGNNLPSQIISKNTDEITEEKLKEYQLQGYSILDVPIEFYDRFEMDMEQALMDIAGISVSQVTKFITFNNLSACYNKGQNPFTSNIISLGMKDNLEIKDFFLPNLVPEELYSKPLFIHIDPSLTGDIEGIGCVARMGYKYINKYNDLEGEFIQTKELMLRHVFSLGIKCPTGSEISFQKLRNFLYYLKYQLSWNIKVVSLDSYQSADCIQQLVTMGFKDATTLSLDRTPDGYLSFKYAVNEKRISILPIKELELELINLERNNMTGKIDHNPDNTKDISDGIAGACYSASLYKYDTLDDSAAVVFEGANDYSDNPQDILSNLLTTEMYNKNDNIILEDDAMNNHINNNPELSLHDALNLYLDNLTQETEPSKVIYKPVIEKETQNKEDILNLAKKIKSMTLNGTTNENINYKFYNNQDEFLI